MVAEVRRTIEEPRVADAIDAFCRRMIDDLAHIDDVMHGLDEGARTACVAAMIERLVPDHDPAGNLVGMHPDFARSSSPGRGWRDVNQEARPRHPEAGRCRIPMVRS